RDHPLAHLASSSVSWLTWASRSGSSCAPPTGSPPCGGPPPLCPHETRGRARGSLTDGRAGPAFARRAVGSECNLIVLDAVDVPVCLRRMLAFLSASIAPERLIVSDGLLPDQRAFLAVTAWAAWSTGPSPLPLLVSRPVHLSSSF